MFDKRRYLVMLASNISDFSSLKYTKIKISSRTDLPLKKH